MSEYDVLAGALPKNLARLKDLAFNLYWTWNRHARVPFARLDREAWRTCGRNPAALLQNVRPERVAAMSRDRDYLDRYDRAVAGFDGYMEDTRCRTDLDGAFCASHPAAFFSLEFALHSSIPIYAGGLGILAGDFLKSASDLRIPLVGLGLLYKKGYISQRIGPDGLQSSEDAACDLDLLPIAPALDPNGTPVSVRVEAGDRDIHARVWRLDVGHVPLYLLDTDVEENAPADRTITHRLYDDDRNVRALQQMLLGVGGIRALDALGITPRVYHMNEGKTAFLLLELLAQLTDTHRLTLAEATEIVRASSHMTLHTTVVAGNERFSRNTLDHCLHSYVEKIGIAWDDFWQLGRDEPGPDGSFIMTVCGLKLCGTSNGVSRTHAGVTREVWKSVWGEFHPAELPITSVRNGVHLGTWVGPEMGALLDTHLGSDWRQTRGPNDTRRRTAAIPNKALWETRSALRHRTVDYVKRRVAGDLRPDVLTVVWARRFAPYKRPALILSDPDRLIELLANPNRPMQVVIAGKAHPDDREGCDLVRKVVEFSRDPRALGRVAFLPNFDLRTARHLVWGADVWLNTPTRLMEASGTSGQKSAVNGGLNLSVLDGWWEEAFDDLNGWAIGGLEGGDDEDESDADALYSLLEQVVAPMFYARDEEGIPREWIRLMKHSLETIPPAYNAHRMVDEYVRRIYMPAAARTDSLSSDNFAAARELAAWKKTVPSRFSSAGIEHIEVSGMEQGRCRAGETVTIRANVRMGELSHDEALVEGVVFYAEGADSTEQPLTVRLDPLMKGTAGECMFIGAFRPERSGRYTCGVRILPHHPRLACKQELGLVRWS